MAKLANDDDHLAVRAVCIESGVGFSQLGKAPNRAKDVAHLNSLLTELLRSL